MDRVARVLTGKVSAWLVLIAYVVVFGGLSSALGSLSTASRDQNLPAEAQSAIAAAQLKQFPGSDKQPVLVVTTRTDGQPLTAADQQSIATVAATLTTPTGGGSTGGRPTGATVSEDGRAAITIVPVTSSDDDSSNKQVVADLRTTIADHLPSGLTMQVTGGPAFGADIAASFAGADVTLLLVTVGIVAVLLLITYRSPLLWLVPLAVVGLADRLAGTLTNLLSLVTGWHAEGGIVSVLVFGAGTNYALLMISRYREELHHHTDHREALRVAWRRSIPAILASNLTVVGGMLTLLVALLPQTRGLGLSSAAGLLTALVAVLVGLPAALAIVGRGIFWPFVPRADASGAADDRPGFWGRVAHTVTARPVVSLVAGLALLGIFASGLASVRIGLDQADQFRVASESASGLRTVAAHFPAGETSPLTVVGRADRTAQLQQAIADTPGVVRVVPSGQDATHGRVALTVTGSAEPGSDASLQLVRDLRAATATVDGAEAVVGGQTAQDLDRRDAQTRDFLLIAPLILLVCFVVVGLLTRSLLAPLLLLTVNAASAAAAVGAGWWLSRAILDTPAYAIEVPLFAFLFLVALGVDYTIFLVERIRHEVVVGATTREATVLAVRHTGAVITSAGVVLAAVFAALGVLPLVVMGQLGIIVCLGVLVDTLVVRTVIVPALFALVGERIWWPFRASVGSGSRTTR
ncbi:MMPL family transporter [Aestuariimicrobium soli]|uniref:MMPL family transporter n=1 Tax=Aestuariimicrobium soli TaxID=2035834 RepID=UPI003EBF3C21